MKKTFGDSFSDVGLVRTENQDSVLSLPERGLYVIADGMGGGEGGAVASRILCEEMADVRKPGKMKDAVKRAHKRIAEFAVSHHYHMMGTTVAALMVDGDDAIVLWAGDSRVYRLRGGKTECLTNDHTIGNELSRLSPGSLTSGMAKRSHPLAHVLTRAVGVEKEVIPEELRVDLKGGDRFLICTDGVHDVLADETIGQYLDPAHSRQEALQDLSGAVRKAGAHDNFSMIVADVVDEKG